jgi:hypothetical protein
MTIPWDKLNSIAQYELSEAQKYVIGDMLKTARSPPPENVSTVVSLEKTGNLETMALAIGAIFLTKPSTKFVVLASGPNRAFIMLESVKHFAELLGVKIKRSYVQGFYTDEGGEIAVTSPADIPLMMAMVPMPKGEEDILIIFEPTRIPKKDITSMLILTNPSSHVIAVIDPAKRAEISYLTELVHKLRNGPELISPAVDMACQSEPLTDIQMLVARVQQLEREMAVVTARHRLFVSQQDKLAQKISACPEHAYRNMGPLYRCTNCGYEVVDI